MAYSIRYLTVVADLGRGKAAIGAHRAALAREFFSRSKTQATELAADLDGSEANEQAGLARRLIEKADAELAAATLSP